MLTLERGETADRSKINEEKKTLRPPEELLSPIFGGVGGSSPSAALTEDDKVLPNEPVITSEDVQEEGQMWGIVCCSR